MRHPSSALALIVLATPSAFGQSSDDFPTTDNHREVTNFNVEPVRGMEQASDGTLYAINSHGSQIVHHMDLGSAPEEIFPTLNLPVAIALWGEDRIVVASAGTHALALHDRAGGAILNVLPLPSEPADLVIDPDLDMAFVACQGENVVVKVNLTSFAEVVRYEIDSERPRFLYFDRGTDDPADNRLFVAPFVSGNNSAPFRSLIGGQASIVDGDPYPQVTQLPDEDLFEIDVNSNSPTAAVAVMRRVGTLLTAHGRHPNGDYWALNVDSSNKDANRQSEPLLKGDFAKNRVWIGTPSIATPTPTTSPSEFVDLDEAVAGSGYAPADSVAFPFGLAFDRSGTTDRVFITSPLADCVSVRDASGNVVARADLPQGSIPLDVELDTITNVLVFVYCWGTNEILVVVPGTTFAPISLDLGLDPTPEPIRRGREHWYDGHRSENARSSCNTCHPGGKSDFLGWQISDDPTDRKDVMVTQSLLGIEDTFPYHWRGERALIDFNDAFVGLLGGAGPLLTVPVTGEPGIEFEDFQAFVFSLQPHANPFQDLSRTVVTTADPTPIGVLGDAVNGAAAFQNVQGLLGRTCAECHIPQTGTSGDFNNDDAAFDLPQARTLETSHLRELTHKNQPLVSLPVGTFPRLGFGIAHNGLALDLFAFVAGGVFGLTLQEVADVTAFVKRFDQGTAPLTHEARLFDGTDPAVDSFIQNALMDQASAAKRWIDLVAFGTFIDPSSGVPTQGRWWFNPAINRFECNDGTTPAQPFSTFQVSGTSMVFLGLPPENGFRFGLDPDNDGLIDGLEPTFGTDPFINDFDTDGQPDGYEVLLGSTPTNPASVGTDNTLPTGTATLDFASSSLAKLLVVASEEVTVSATFGITGSPNVKTYSSPVLGRVHTVVLQGLDPSTESGLSGITAQVNSYVANLTLTDRSNNTSLPSSSLTVPFTSGEMVLDPTLAPSQPPLVVEALSGSMSTSGTTRTITATVELGQRHTRPGPISASATNGLMVLLEALVESPSGSGVFIRPTTPPTTTSGTFIASVTNQTRTIPASILPGNYIATPLTSTVGSVPGKATVDVTLTNLSVGQLVRLRVVAILDPFLPITSPPVFKEESIGRYILPATDPDKRGIQLTVP